MLMHNDLFNLTKDMAVAMEARRNDQWSNIIEGVDLIRRKRRQNRFTVMTFKPLLTAKANKMKTEKGAVWLDADKTSP